MAMESSLFSCRKKLFYFYSAHEILHKDALERKKNSPNNYVCCLFTTENSLIYIPLHMGKIVSRRGKGIFTFKSKYSTIQAKTIICPTYRHFVFASLIRTQKYRPVLHARSRTNTHTQALLTIGFSASEFFIPQPTNLVFLYFSETSQRARSFALLLSLAGLSILLNFLAFPSTHLRFLHSTLEVDPRSIKNT